MRFPLDIKIKVPEYPEPGAFGAIRKHDIHTGIDLYCSPGDEVKSIEGGIVFDIINFTGSHADSCWWNDTKAVIIKSDNRFWLYGEVDPTVNIGDIIIEGDFIGRVLTVLKKNKGKPMTMLHIELYNSFFENAVVWNLNEPKPISLEDPTLILKSI
jgi:Peptidase family M23